MRPPPEQRGGTVPEVLRGRGLGAASVTVLGRPAIELDPDLVILDLTIPDGMCGRETMMHLRRVDPQILATPDARRLAERADAHANPRPRPRYRLVEQWLVAILGQCDGLHLLFGNLTTNEQRNHCRNEGERQDKRPCQCQHDRDRHRRKHLALDAGEGEQRGEDKEDDRLTVDRRAHHLTRRFEHLVQPFGQGQHPAFMMLSLCQPHQAILDDDY